MFTVAITGETGAGKSTLTRVWGKLGANVFDLDSIAKAEWSCPEVMEEAERRWGPGLHKNGVPIFKKIAEKVFSGDEDYRFALSLVHPGAMMKAARMARNLGGWTVMEIPLLFETGWFDLIDCVVCVTSTDELRITRNSGRGWSDDEIFRRERFLIGSAEKQALSDMVLRNTGSLEAWKARARELGELMRKMSAVYEFYVCCGNPDEAGKIASALLEKHLAASAGIEEIDSMFHWKGEIKNVREWKVSCLTMEKNLRGIMECVSQLHSYELPAVTAREIGHSDFRTLKWVVENCT
jgi:dephospho-CoA kinase